MTTKKEKGGLPKGALPYEAHLVREDGRLERFCAHGIGHTVGHRTKAEMSQYDWVHGCDGCCAGWPRQGMAHEAPSPAALRMLQIVQDAHTDLLLQRDQQAHWNATQRHAIENLLGALEDCQRAFESVG